MLMSYVRLDHTLYSINYGNNGDSLGCAHRLKVFLADDWLAG